MTDTQKLTDCYLMAEKILRPFEKGMKTIQRGVIKKDQVNDPLAYVCLAHLLYSWRYEKK